MNITVIITSLQKYAPQTSIIEFQVITGAEKREEKTNLVFLITKLHTIILNFVVVLVPHLEDEKKES
jgi:hypothetical protein